MLLTKYFDCAKRSLLRWCELIEGLIIEVKGYGPHIAFVNKHEADYTAVQKRAKVG